MKIRNLLIKERQKKGLSLRAAADLCGIDFTFLSCLERCERNGTFEIWSKIQIGYGIKNKDMWSIMTTYKNVEKLDK